MFFLLFKIWMSVQWIHHLARWMFHNAKIWNTTLDTKMNFIDAHVNQALQEKELIVLVRHN